MLALMAFAVPAGAQKVDYSGMSVPEETGIDFRRITSDNDHVVMPQVKRGRTLSWWAGNVVAVSPKGDKLAYLANRNNSVNIYIRNLDGSGGALQRTKRTMVEDFAYSPDGGKIVFMEGDKKSNRIFITSAATGYVCRQITNNERDFAPAYSQDMKNIFFSRRETSGGYAIWRYTLADNSLSSIASGTSPLPTTDADVLLCVRTSSQGRGEIWRINIATGNEECIVSDAKRSFSTPSLSPDGRWILMTGSSLLVKGNTEYANTDIYVCRPDGSELTQLTYHAADDLSPAWSSDGLYIYFVSQRGSSAATANVWRMPFRKNY